MCSKIRQLTMFDEEELTGVEDSAPDVVKDAWKKAKKDMKNNFTRLQQLPKGHIALRVQRWVNMRAVFEKTPRFEDYQKFKRTIIHGKQIKMAK